MNTRKASKDTGDSKTVEGDIVQFGLETEDSLEMIVDHKEPKPEADITSLDITKIDMRLMNAFHQSVSRINHYIGNTSHNTHLDISDIRKAYEEFKEIKGLYVNMWETISKSISNLSKIKSTLTEAIDVNKSRYDIIIPEHIYKDIISGLDSETQKINNTLETRCDLYSNDTNAADMIGMNDLLIDAHTNKSLLKTILAIGFIGKKYEDILSSIKLTGYTIEKNNTYMESLGRFMKRLPKDVTVIETYEDSSGYISGRVIESKKKGRFMKIYNSFRSIETKHHPVYY